MNLKIKEPLKNKVEKAYKKLSAKNKYITNKEEFVLIMLENAIAELYSSRTIS